MAVTVIDNRTTLDELDALTNINQGTLNTSDYAEATGSVALDVNIATDQLYWQGTAINFTTTGNELIYIWSSNTALQNSWSAGANSSHAIWLSDGTNELVIFQSGNDREVFKHSLTQVQFQCFVIDVDYLSTKNTNGEIYVNAGSFAAFNPAAITQVGSYYVTLSKALGGGYNVFLDIIRYGGREQGIRILDGLSTDVGTFYDIAVEDRKKDNGKAHGIIREYTAGAYGLQGTVKFGSTTPTGNTWFEDSNVTLTFENRDVSDDKYAIYVYGNSTDTNVFQLNNVTISSARPGVLIDMSSSNIDTLILDTVNFSRLLNSILFPTDTTSTEHQVINCTFESCGQIDPGSVIFQDNSISNSNVSSAVLLDSNGSDNWKDLTFNSDGTGHAIEITATGTYNFNGFVFNDYYSGSSVNSSIYNNSGGAVTINITNGETPSVYNSAGSTTTINNNVNITFSGLKDNTEIRVYSGGTSTELDGIENATGGTTNNREFTFSIAVGIEIDYTIHALNYDIIQVYGYTTPSNDITLPINQRFDRYYYNP